MQITNTLMTLALLAMGINAAPLNINMGAYSPALVVGDGALTFGGEEAAPAAGAEGGAQRQLARRQDAGDKKVEKRQSGFDRALTFAEAALTKGPDIELGTGEGGAGVGIKIDNNPKPAAGGAAGGAAGRE
ncbi:hypothetical protein CGRA01v4_07756 [Colletotrichum graminicola]|uniref:Uncharacterized protein n=1 Tax=Colletotrichum graminicola (strain M1.001 / M2 / FGSC 10212) TaxID=645133 RepID=E3QPQ2_COLGM|nr:uncharacterized protein GLRG_07973 [Colletotrichum graminicola M1.001]EFQ32829.1 hypothetical protein GLRG_07973 [Colletotrichum graminicola M1.001]WDK16473.1 hypothetical protein CGRA01v4_07756 [Colletotrichum graminicola]